jgi:hypothetical protein
MAESVEETLAQEAEQRPRAGAAALAAGALNLLGGIAAYLVTSSAPDDDERVLDVLETLERRLTTGEPSQPGLVAEQIAYIGDNAIPFIVSNLVAVVGTLLIIPALAYLFRATRARRPEFPRGVIAVVIAGAVAAAVGLAVSSVAFALEASSFADAEVQTSGAAREIRNESTVVAGQIIGTLGRFLLAIGIVLLALNAMRVGLLTRFLGVLGMLVAFTFVFPLDQQGLVRSFWLIALGLLILGRFPKTPPPAWQTGRAEPWPTQQELRERREAARSGQSPPARNGAAEPERLAEDENGGAPHPGSRKRKRKRRQ